jgi:hypothetical protein
VSVVSCHVGLSATGPSPGQRSPTEYSVPECDCEASKNEKTLEQQGLSSRGGGGTYGSPMNISLSGEAEVFPVDALKSYKRNTSVGTLSLNLDITLKFAVKFRPQ